MKPVTPKISIPASERIRVFISYSHDDRPWLEQVKKYLKGLVRSELIELWDDTRIPSGAQWHEEIISAVNSTSIAILLISADFIHSDYIYNTELQLLLCERREKDEIVILGLNLRRSSVEEIEHRLNSLQEEIGNRVYRFQMVNPVSKPLNGCLPDEQDGYLVQLRDAVFQAAQQSLASADKRRGTEHLNNGDADTAIYYFSRAIDLSPDSKTYLNRGKAYTIKGDLDHSIGDYSLAIKYDGGADAYSGRGFAHRKNGNYSQALKDFESANSLKSGSVSQKAIANTYASRGKSYFSRGDFLNAINDYTNARGRNPSSVSNRRFATAYARHGENCFKREEFLKAAKNYRTAKQLYSSSVSNWDITRAYARYLTQFLANWWRNLWRGGNQNQKKPASTKTKNRTTPRVSPAKPPNRRRRR